MAKNLQTVETLLSNYVITGLQAESAEANAFVAYCRSEYGKVAECGADEFAGLKLSGKGDKAKGALNRGTVKFTGGHNTALRVLAGASALQQLESSIGALVGKLDATEVVSHWLTRWQARQAAPQSAPQS